MIDDWHFKMRYDSLDSNEYSFMHAIHACA